MTVHFQSPYFIDTKNTKLLLWPWLSHLLLSMFYVSIQATVRHPHTLSEMLPAYAITDHFNLLNSSRCRTEIKKFRESIDRGVLWSLRMLDASGDASPGFVNGNNYWLGDRLDCDYLSANVTPVYSDKHKKNISIYRNPNEETPPFEVHFFVANINHDSTIQYHVGIANEDQIVLGLCLPASCTTSDISTMLNEVLRNGTLLVGQLYSANFRLLKISDLVDNHEWLLNGRMILIMHVTLILLTLCGPALVGTIFDITVHQKRLHNIIRPTYDSEATSEKPSETNRDGTGLSEVKPENRFLQYLVCFSFYSNVQRTFKIDGTAEGVPIFHGLKFFGMMWIIMVHTLSYGKHVVGNRATVYEMGDNFFMQIINNGTLSLDTFFFISGFMLTNVFLKKQQRAVMQKSWQTKVKGFLLSIGKRYIRITPAYFILILATILNFSWHEKISLFSISENANVLCSKYWWRNLFYINNLFEWDEICLTWSWYLSNDMQYFIFGSFLLILSATHFNYALGIAGVSLGSSIFLNGYTAYSIHYIPTLDEEMETFRFLYTRPWLRISPYLLGMGTAQLLTKWNYTLELPKKILAACWIFAIFCNCAVLFGLLNKSIPLGLSVFYTAFSRTSWGVGISWLVIACCTNNGGFVNKFLSLRLWIPLSRTTYCCYLINPFIIISIYRLSSYPLFTDTFTTGTIFLGMLVSSYICAFVLSAVAEVPYMHLQRILVESARRAQ